MLSQFTHTYFTDFYTLVTEATLVLKSKSLPNYDGYMMDWCGACIIGERIALRKGPSLS